MAAPPRTPSDARNLLEELVRFDTVSRNSNLALIEFVADYLSGCGIRSEIIKDETGTKADLTATIGPSDIGGLMLAGHTVRIRDARERAGMTQQALADHCGVSRAAVAQWELSVTRPSLEHLGRTADALGVWVSWLTGEGEFSGQEEEAVPYRPRGRSVPVIDFVQAGHWNAVADPYPPGRGMDILITEQTVGENAFGLLVKGNSMAPDFLEDDKIIVDPEIAPQPGDLVVAKLDAEEEATFKKYRPRGSDADGQPLIDLVPLNEDWPRLRIDADHPGHIIGTVVEHRRFLRR